MDDVLSNEMQALSARALQRLTKQRRDRAINTAPAGNEDRIGLFEKTEITIGHYPYATGGAEFAFINGRYRKAIPVVTQLRSRQAEDLYRDAKFKGTQTVIGQNHDLWG